MTKPPKTLGLSADHIPDAGKMVAAPADPVAGEREAVKQAIHDWVREDAPINQKMTWTPALNTALENRILAARARLQDREGGVS